MEFITDRTYADVQRALYFKNIEDTTGWDSLTEDEQEEWLAGLKGALNYTDLNRIEINTKAIDVSLSAQLGISSVITDFKQDWSMYDKPSFEKIIDNINLLINSYSIYALPLLEKNTKIDFLFLNKIEQTLKDISEFKIGQQNKVKIPWTTDYIIDENGNLMPDDLGNHILLTDYLRSGDYNIYVEAPANTTIKAYYYINSYGSYYYEKAEEFVSDGNQIQIPKVIYNNIKIYVSSAEDIDLENTVSIYVE